MVALDAAVTPQFELVQVLSREGETAFVAAYVEYEEDGQFEDVRCRWRANPPTGVTSRSSNAGVYVAVGALSLCAPVVLADCRFATPASRLGAGSLLSTCPMPPKHRSRGRTQKITVEGDGATLMPFSCRRP